MIQFRQTTSRRDKREAQKLAWNIKGTYRKYYVVCVVIAVGVVGVWKLNAWSHLIDPFLLAFILGSIVYLTSWAPYMARQVSALRWEKTEKGDPQAFQFISEVGIGSTSSTVHAEFKWSAFIAAYENESWLILSRTGHRLIALHKAGVPPEGIALLKKKLDEIHVDIKTLDRM